MQAKAKLLPNEGQQDTRKQAFPCEHIVSSIYIRIISAMTAINPVNSSYRS